MLGQIPSSGKSRISLNTVCSAVVLISFLISWTSASTMARSSSVKVPLAALTASSLTRCNISWISFKAPSADWTMEIPSWAFADACVRPRICRRIFSEMARPAASSAALLIRQPDESFSVVFLFLETLIPNCRPAFHASIFVLTESIPLPP